MEVKTYRAASMYEALQMVRCDLGPEAVVMQTRNVRSRRLLGLFARPHQVEVTASAGVNVPSRLPSLRPTVAAAASAGPQGLATSEGLSVLDAHAPAQPIDRPAAGATAGSRPALEGQLRGQATRLQGMVQDLCRRPDVRLRHDLPDSLFRLFTDLIDVDIDETTAGALIERVRAEAPNVELTDPVLVKSRIARIIESEISVAGPIHVMPGQHRLVALVGPTGVGKTTTIAKLAANYRLKRRLNVGLITVDTYRIAAVEQLRTYADIIDLPMQVVSTPREMRQAVRRLSGLDLILMDTAGRSPRDEIKIQELKAFLTEAGADEVHLVLSSMAGARSLEQTVDRFAAVGTTSLILTKLDEAAGLGNLLPLLQSDALPLSYLTNGQNVPDDIETAEPTRLANLILSGESSGNDW
ncbi:MAG: flagellar biosynthesis protein FlhF [Pirellulales bacterium]|nr:flagellar biosynthesis protein FlhF [Pirellulales bacterium]